MLSASRCHIVGERLLSRNTVTSLCCDGKYYFQTDQEYLFLARLLAHYEKTKTPCVQVDSDQSSKQPTITIE